jgi:hypothetical protein
VATVIVIHPPAHVGAVHLQPGVTPPASCEPVPTRQVGHSLLGADRRHPAGGPFRGKIKIEDVGPGGAHRGTEHHPRAEVAALQPAWIITDTDVVSIGQDGAVVGVHRPQPCHAQRRRTVGRRRKPLAEGPPHCGELPQRHLRALPHRRENPRPTVDVEIGR